MPQKLYDWDKWFRQKKIRLVRGVDYHCTTIAMVQQIRNAAATRRLSIRIEELDSLTAEGLVVTLERKAVCPA